MPGAPTPTRTLVFGRGYIGGAFAASPAFAPCALARVDVTDRQAVRDEVRRWRPEVVVNAAGKTDLEWCRDHEAEAWRVNVDGAVNLRDAAAAYGAKLVHLGSACVFDQEHGAPGGDGFVETDVPSPRAAYTIAKARADVLLAEPGGPGVLIVRLRQPFSGAAHPRNLITKVLGYERLITSPNSMTYVPDLIAAARSLLDADAHGVFHVCNTGTLSPFSLGTMARAASGKPASVTAISKAELDAEDERRGRVRRVDAVISSAKLAALGLPMPDVRARVHEALAAYRAAASL